MSILMQTNVHFLLQSLGYLTADNRVLAGQKSQVVKLPGLDEMEQRAPQQCPNCLIFLGW